MSDKQNKTTMSDEAQVTRVYLSEPLRSLEDVYDELNIENGIATVTRRIGVNEDLSLYVLETPTTENLGNINIKTFKDDTYIYIKEYEGIHYSSKYIIESDYSDAFVTKAETASQINQSATEIEINVNKKLDDYSTTTEMNSAISATAKGINLEVSKKVGEDEIISKINQSAEQISIEADKINLNGVVTANENFKINADGSMEAANGSFTGGTILLKGGTNSSNARFKIVDTNNSNIFSYITPDSLQIATEGDSYLAFNTNTNFSVGGNGVWINARYQTDQIELIADDVICSNKVHALSYNYDSLERIKNNIIKFDKNAIDILKKGEVYYFNYKKEDKNTKPHVGFIIGNKYKTPEEVIATNGDAIDSYTMVSILWKAVQEQQEIIEDLQNQINELKGESNGQN